MDADSLIGKTVRIKATTLDATTQNPHMWAGLWGEVTGQTPFGGLNVAVGNKTKIFEASDLEVVADAAPPPPPPARKDEATPAEASLVYESPLTAINSPTNPRRRRGLDVDSLAALADNIRKHGLFTPILARPLPVERVEETADMNPRPSLEVVAGERRWRAVQLAELKTVPFLVKPLTDAEVLEIQLIENIEREDLDAMEEAEGFDLLRTRLGYTVEQIADRIGKGRGASYVRKTMKLLDLCPEAREAMYEGHLGRSTGLVVARYPAERQAAVLAYIKSQAVKAGKGTEPAAFRLIAPMVHTRFNLKLASAAFDIEDAALLPDAGACSQCPKRTGNEQDLFGDGDMVDGQSCTDDACFAAKKTAHAQRLRANAEAEGLHVIDGDEAKEVRPNPHNPVLKGYVRLSDVAGTVKGGDGEEREITFEDALRAKGRKAPKPTMLIDPHTGKGEKVIPLALADELTPEAQTTAPPPTAGAFAHVSAPLTEEDKAWRDGPVRNAGLMRLFDAVRSRPRTEDELRLALRTLLSISTELPRLERYLGWDEALRDSDEPFGVYRAKCADLDATQLGEVLTMAALEIALTEYGYDDIVPHELLAAYGIDLLAVRDKVADDMQHQDGTPLGDDGEPAEATGEEEAV